MMPVLRVDEEVYESLRSQVSDFGETPNTVLRKLLNLDREGGSPKPSRLPAGVLLNEKEYWAPILEVIESHDGAAPASIVREEVGRRLEDRLKPEDFARNRTGGVRWKNRAAWARARMIRQGLLKSNSPRGQWEITETGRQWLQSQSG